MGRTESKSMLRKINSRIMINTARIMFVGIIVIGFTACGTFYQILGSLYSPESSFGSSATSNQRYTAESDFSFSGSDFGIMRRVGNRFISAGSITGYNGRAAEVRIPPIINRTKERLPITH